MGKTIAEKLAPFFNIVAAETVVISTYPTPGISTFPDVRISWICADGSGGAIEYFAIPPEAEGGAEGDENSEAVN